ncbi:hypothetical protein [Anaerotignum sp.]
MEKEKKGLFGRLLDFWKEKIGIGETKGIGFWNGAKNLENPFAGDAVSLKQGEKKKTFWEEKVETILGEKEEEGGLLEQEKKLFFAEAEDGQEKDSEAAEDGEKTEKRKVSNLFLTEVFREERQEEAEESKMGQAFLWEMPEMEKERRSIVPVTEETKQEKTPAAEAEQEMPKTKTAKREEPQTEMSFDIEKLMQQMTKKLWEERESCGRRLRG